MDKQLNHKKLDTYLGLCTEVYELSKPEAPSDAYAFYHKYVKAAKGPILEPMCGTGCFLIPLLEEGFDIHGFDASKHMLNRLNEKAKVKMLRPNVWSGFVQDLARPENYNLIFIPSGSFCLITDLHDAKTALRKFYENLNEGGIFLVEADTLQSVPTEIEELKVRIYEQDQLLDMLKAAGFKHTRTLKLLIIKNNLMSEMSLWFMNAGSKTYTKFRSCFHITTNLLSCL